MTLKEEKCEYVQIPRSILGSDNFWDMLHFWIYKVYEI
jgi:hypothetical protein